MLRIKRIESTWKRWFGISEWAFEPACGQRRESRCGSAAICHLNRGHMGQACPCPPLGRLVLSFSCGFLRTPLSSCAFTHTGTGRMETQRSEAEVGQWSRRGDQPLAEVVFCAVGRVVMLPLVEMTAQSTALLALVADGAGVEPDRRKWTSSWNRVVSTSRLLGWCVKASVSRREGSRAPIPSWIHRCKK